LPVRLQVSVGKLGEKVSEQTEIETGKGREKGDNEGNCQRVGEPGGGGRGRKTSVEGQEGH